MKVWNKFATLESIMTPTLVNHDSHVAVDCAFGAFSLKEYPAFSNLYWKIDRALQFNTDIAEFGEKVVKHLHRNSATGNEYTALHVRVEKDWILHCS